MPADVRECPERPDHREQREQQEHSLSGKRVDEMTKTPLSSDNFRQDGKRSERKLYLLVTGIADLGKKRNKRRVFGGGTVASWEEQKQEKSLW